jgi:hypothetical protein
MQQPHVPNHKRLLIEVKKILKRPEAYRKAPLWLAEVLSSASSFIDNPILGSRVFNERGLHAQRVHMAARMAARRRASLSHLVSPEDKAFFDTNGFVIKENFLPEEQFEALYQELTDTTFFARETLQGDTVTRRIALDHRVLPDLPATQQLLADPVWKGLLRYIGSFNVQPLYYIQTIISHVRKARPDPQTNLHADTFHSSVKAWLFLTDVAEDEGPFVYVPGSHQLSPQRLAWEKKRSLDAVQSDRMSSRGSFRVEEKDLAALGLGQPRAFAVKKNTLVVADTFGFHARGKSVRPSVRIEIWAFSRRNPFLPIAGFDPLKLPVLRHRLIPIYWWALDRLEEKGIKNNPWRKVGELKAGDPPRFIKK